MIYALNSGVIFKELNDLKSILNVTLNSERKCFKSLKKKECIERRNSRTCISEEDSSYLGNKCGRTGSLCKGNAVVAGVGVNERCKLAACFPVKLAAVNDNAAESCSVTADKLCCRMNYDICAVLNRTEEIRSGKGAVDNERNLVCVSDLSKCIDIGNITVGVAESLKENSLCIGLYSVLYFVKIVDINESGVDAVLGKSVCEEVVCTAVDCL